MKRIVASFVVAASFAAVSGFAADATSINGWISDSMCGAKHAGSGSACVKKCIEGGMKPVFVDPEKMVAARKAGSSAWDLHERAFAGEFAPEKPCDARGML